ncbi:hypothetical protein [Streptomyces sp. NPDC093071]|uniref:hypothetical protein n=1 Tax=Streptomyces sp. NPDC093071 TaxID=3366022 RepID=UPI003809CEB9
MKYCGNRRVVAAILISTAVTTLAACGPADTGADSKSSADAGGPGPSTPGPEDSFDGLSGPQIGDKAMYDGDDLVEAGLAVVPTASWRGGHRTDHGRPVDAASRATAGRHRTGEGQGGGQCGVEPGGGFAGDGR